ncbi:MAG: acyl-CoA dehydrogenase family protein, partial [Desulfomonilia bacterium]|nr:acyl-CoA dehydrogenase family protein [Desulfomonilia bacterium]
LGGIGQGISALCLILERISQVDSSLSGIIFTATLSQELMIASGSRDLLRETLSGANTAHDFLIAACSFCNPAEIQHMPVAQKRGSAYHLTGNLDYVVLGGIASHALVPAYRADRSRYSFFLVDLRDTGIEKSGAVFSLGLHACPAVDMVFDGAKARLVGEEGKGRIYFADVSKKMHIAAAAMSTGIMKGSFKEALAYSKERFQGGCAIINWSEVSMILANMAVKLNVGELCVAQACQALEQSTHDWQHHCTAAALHVHELACDAVTDGVQVLGGNGYMKDYGQEKRFRDARQVQALLGIAPLKKISLIRDISGFEELCG